MHFVMLSGKHVQSRLQIETPKISSAKPMQGPPAITAGVIKRTALMKAGSAAL